MLEVSRILSTWVCGTAAKAKAEDLAFRPRSTSIMPVEGHWKGKGDILCRPQVYFPFAVECKCVESGKLDSIIEAPQWPVWDWWKQAVRQAEASKPILIPMLVFTRSRRANYVMLWNHDARTFFPGLFENRKPPFTVSSSLLTVIPPITQSIHEPVVILLLSDFCAVVPPSDFPDLERVAFNR